jgi:hypothetical protein
MRMAGMAAGMAQQAQSKQGPAAAGPMAGPVWSGRNQKLPIFTVFRSPQGRGGSNFKLQLLLPDPPHRATGTLLRQPRQRDMLLPRPSAAACALGRRWVSCGGTVAAAAAAPCTGVGDSRGRRQLSSAAAAAAAEPADFVVIGAGPVGASTAWYLAEDEANADKRIVLVHDPTDRGAHEDWSRLARLSFVSVIYIAAPPPTSHLSPACCHTLKWTRGSG